MEAAMQQAQSPMPQTQTQAQAQTQAPESPDQRSVDGLNRLGLAAAAIVYNKKNSEYLVDMMAEVEDPADAAAGATQMVMQLMQEQTKGINPQSVYSVAPAVVIFLLEMGEVAGLWEGVGSDEVADALDIVGEMADEGGAAMPEWLKRQALGGQRQEPEAPASGAVVPFQGQRQPQEQRQPTGGLLSRSA